jgi:hypothetical protein
MGYRVKIQRIQRPASCSYYLNFPIVLAETLEVKKGETFEWTVKDRNTLIVKRVNPPKTKKKK